MRIGLWTIGFAALALASCGSEAPPAELAEQADPAPEQAQEIAVEGPERRILAFGDSLFAGYNLAEEEGYPEQLEAALRARGINARVVDAGVSGDTTAAGLQRLSFVLDNEEEGFDLALLELGGNDLLRGLPVDSTRENLTAIMEDFYEEKIPVLIMGMRAPPNMGAQYQQAFDAIYPQLAREYEADLVPFFLEPVYARPDLNLPDRIHPTAEGIGAIVAATVEEVEAALEDADG